MKTNDPKIVSLPDAKLIEAEAAEWVMRLQDGDAPKSVMADFDGWCLQSTRHRETFNQLSNFWGGLDFVAQLADYAENDAAREPLKHDRTERRVKTFKRFFTGAIAASLIATSGLYSYKFVSSIDRGFSASYETAIGEQETVVLPDGSQIILNTNSAILVAYSKQKRKLTLTKGEVFFDVEPDKSKPFSVHTNKGVVTAVGTAFSVRLMAEKVDVLVTEGRVSLSASTSLPASEIINSSKHIIVPQVLEVSAGQTAVLDNGVKKIAMVLPLTLEKEVDWQDGELAFKGETLEQVIREISRYTDVNIEISGDELRAQRIVAYYKVGDIDRLFEALHLMAKIEVKQVSSTHVVLYRED